MATNKLKLWYKKQDVAMDVSKSNLVPFINDLPTKYKKAFSAYFRMLLQEKDEAQIIEELQWLVESLEYEKVSEEWETEQGGWVEL